MHLSTPTVPFTDAATLRDFLATEFYNRDSARSFAAIFAFWGVSSMEELLAVPARVNSGSISTFANAWFALFPFVDMNDQYVVVDDVFIGNDGYSLIFWGRWNGRCNADLTLPDGETIALAGKSFGNVRYAYKLSFDRETKKAALFEGIFDLGEWGRLMDSPEYAAASAAQSFYPA